MFRDGPERLLVFRVGTERFAVRLSAVDEVVDAPPVRPLPDTARRVMGVTTIRGALVTIYDPRPLLNVTGAVDDAALLFVHRDTRVGLAVGGVHDTVLVDRSDMRPAPASEVSEKLLIGVVKRGQELIGILDAAALVDSAVGIAEANGGRT